MNLIVSVDRNWGIGKNGELLISIPEDMNFFKEKTLHKTVIMGRKTFESLPGQKPLANRRNIVLTTQKDYSRPGIEVCRSVAELLKMTASAPEGDLYVIGGESVYRELLPYCSVAYVTKIDAVFDARQRMPDLDRDQAWKLTREEPWREYKVIRYCFTEYNRIDDDKLV